MSIFFVFLLLLACFKASVSESEALQNLFISAFENIDTSTVQYFFHLDGNICICFCLHKKVQIADRETQIKLPWLFFAFCNSAGPQSVYFLSNAKIMISCTPRNQSYRWNFIAVMIRWYYHRKTNTIRGVTELFIHEWKHYY